jgi:GNAT superfamily N-acetyltransferase
VVRELDSAWATIAMGAESHLVPKRLAKGSRCFGAWLGHELVGYGWWSTRPEWIGEVELEITPDAHEAYVWNCVTLDPHRRKGVFRSVVTSLVAQARGEGVTRLWIASSADIAVNSITQAGFVPILRFETAVRLGMRWLRIVPVTGVDPGLAASAGHAAAVKPGWSIRRSRPRSH